MRITGNHSVDTLLSVAAASASIDGGRVGCGRHVRSAAAFVVLAGQTPFREMEATEIYRAGWASTVVVRRGKVYEEERALLQLGIHLPEGWELSREVLSRAGVPNSSIRVTEEEVEGGTIEELQAIFRALDPKHKPVILVTSKFHTLRTRLTWKHITVESLRRLCKLHDLILSIRTAEGKNADLPLPSYANIFAS